MFRGKLAVSFKECVEKSSHIHLFLSVCKAYVREPPPKRKKIAENKVLSYLHFRYLQFLLIIQQIFTNEPSISCTFSPPASCELDSAKDSTRFLINSRAHRACWSAYQKKKLWSPALKKSQKVPIMQLMHPYTTQIGIIDQKTHVFHKFCPFFHPYDHMMRPDFFFRLQSCLVVLVQLGKDRTHIQMRPGNCDIIRLQRHLDCLLDRSSKRPVFYWSFGDWICKKSSTPENERIRRLKRDWFQ